MTVSSSNIEFEELLELLERHQTIWRGKLDITIMADIKANLNVTITDGSPPPQFSVDASGVPRGGQTTVPYSGSLVASGGVAPYKFTLDSINGDGTPSKLPDGLVLNSDGSIAGTPTTVGPFEFTVDCQDSAGASAKAHIR